MVFDEEPSSLAGIHQTSRVRNAFSTEQKEYGKREAWNRWACLLNYVFHSYFTREAYRDRRIFKTMSPNGIYSGWLGKSGSTETLLLFSQQKFSCPWDSPGKNTGVDCHFLLQCMKVKSESEVIQSCPTLSDPMDYSLPGSSVHGIFQARVLEWGVIAFSTTRPSHALFMQDTICTFNKPTWIWTGWRWFLHHKQNINCTQSPMNCDCRSQV